MRKQILVSTLLISLVAVADATDKCDKRLDAHRCKRSDWMTYTGAIAATGGAGLALSNSRLLEHFDHNPQQHSYLGRNSIETFKQAKKNGIVLTDEVIHRITDQIPDGVKIEATFYLTPTANKKALIDAQRKRYNAIQAELKSLKPTLSTSNGALDQASPEARKQKLEQELKNVKKEWRRLIETPPEKLPLKPQSQSLISDKSSGNIRKMLVEERNKQRGMIRLSGPLTPEQRHAKSSRLRRNRSASMILVTAGAALMTVDQVNANREQQNQWAMDEYDSSDSAN